MPLLRVLHFVLWDWLHIFSVGSQIIISQSATLQLKTYYPFVVENGGRLAAELVDRLALLVAARRFPGMGAADSRSLHFDNYVRMQHFVRRSTYVPFRRFWGDACTARIHVTSFSHSSWYFRFLSLRRFA
jgi:hypothetical protein